MTTTKNNEHKKLNFSSEREQSQACLNSAEHEKNQGRKVLNVPNLRFPEFEGEWEKCKLGDYGKVITGNTPPTKDVENYENGEYLWASPADLGTIKSITETKTTLSAKGFAKTRTLPKGSVLVTCIGSTIGKTGMATKEMSTNQQINSIVVNDNNDNEFVYYAIQSAFPRYLSSIAVQAVPIISKSAFELLPNKKPCLQEQKRIGKFLSLLDERIATQNKIIEDLKKLKSAISHILFSSKCAIRLSDIANVIMGQSPSSNAYNDQGIGMPLVQGNLDISNGKTTPRLYTAEFNQTAEEGNIILTVRAPVGEVAKATKKVCLGRGVCAIIPHEGNMSDFIYQYLTFYKFMWRKYEQGSTFTSINRSDVRNIPCPKVRNVSILTLLDRKINIEERVIELYQSQKQCMLCQMFI